jgi:hypothetical protein
VVARRAAGVLLIRAWVEEGRLKARVTRTVGGDTDVLNVAGAEELLAAVERWIEHLGAPGEAANGGAPPVTPR